MICVQCDTPFEGTPSEPAGRFCSLHCLFQSMGVPCGACAKCDVRATRPPTSLEVVQQFDREISRRRDAESFYGRYPSPWLSIHRNWARLEGIGDRVIDSARRAELHRKY